MTSKVLDYILESLPKNGSFTVPAALLDPHSKIDKTLLDGKVLVKSKDILTTIPCPFGCGNSETVRRGVKDGKPFYHGRCATLKKYWTVPAEEVELLAFDKTAFDDLVRSGKIETKGTAKLPPNWEPVPPPPKEDPNALVRLVQKSISDKRGMKYALQQIEMDILFALPERSPWQFLRVLRLMEMTVSNAITDFDPNLSQRQWFREGLLILTDSPYANRPRSEQDVSPFKDELCEGLANFLITLVRWRQFREKSDLFVEGKGDALTRAIRARFAKMPTDLERTDRIKKYLYKYLIYDDDGGIVRYHGGPFVSLLEACMGTGRPSIDDIPMDVREEVNKASIGFFKCNDGGWTDSACDVWIEKAVKQIDQNRQAKHALNREDSNKGKQPKTAEEAIQLLCERDRREEDEYIERIRTTLEKNWVIVSEGKEDKGKPKGLIYFESIKELLKSDIDDLARDVVNAPCSCGEWQRALPDALSYPYDAADYYEVAEGEDEPDIYNVTLANGTVVRLGRSLQPHHLSESIDKVRDLTLLFLTDALRFAQSIDSKSCDMWVDALGCFKRVEHAFRMPQSRPILEKMVQLMIDAMTKLDTENRYTAKGNVGKGKTGVTLKEKMGLSTGSKTFDVLKRLGDVVENACQNSKKGEFLYKRKAYVEAVNELWDNQTDPQYAVSRKEFPQISKLWRSIRLNLVAYAKCIIGHSKWLVEEINTEHSHFIITPFETVDEQPHVLNAEPAKYLYSTLNVPEAPREVIPKKNSAKVECEEEVSGDKSRCVSDKVIERLLPPILEIAKSTKKSATFGEKTFTAVDEIKKNLANNAFSFDWSKCNHRPPRFLCDKNFENIKDESHTGNPDYPEIKPYLDLPEKARVAIKELIAETRKNPDKWWKKGVFKANKFKGKSYSEAFMNNLDIPLRFKRDQIEVGTNTYHKGEWRILPEQDFRERYLENHPPKDGLAGS